MDHIQSTVKRLIKKYKTNDPFELADYLKITISDEPLGKNIRGYYQACPKNKLIHLNDNLNSNDRRIVCSHEIGHAILHPEANILFLERHTFCVKKKFEREANRFSAELLIPDDLLSKYHDFTLEQIAAAEALPIELLKLKYNIDI